MALFAFLFAVIHGQGIIAFQTVDAVATSLMSFAGYPVTDCKTG
ncbi:hypothetical protein D1BOALGB6SA_7764 [Olavius sp. associated proteobacterium Delta 1]|nr:hypothetical protein D1BOALGB6SA_7764 [Olavius sp. associated proteobacterium Delta 1]